jgi:hypothetical protein
MRPAPMKHCIAYREIIVGNHVTYVLCGLRAREHNFCRNHARAYREIILGITAQGRRDKEK